MSGLAASLCCLSVGVQRPAQPPSWPHALVATRAPRPPLAAPLTHEFEPQQGFIGAGNDVAAPELLTPLEALARCDGLDRCRGITYRATTNASTNASTAATTAATTAVKTYFKLDGSVSPSTGWTSYLKVGRVSPPAARLRVGGSSGLELILRDQHFTVQNLSIPGANWSFTRPLEGGRYALPSCSLLGDVTLRLREVGGSDRWSTFSTLALGAPAKPLAKPLAATSGADGFGGDRVLAAQDISGALAASDVSSRFPLSAVRAYERSADGRALILRLNLTNSANRPIEIGGLGFALPESPVSQPGVGLEGVVWADPHIGGEHGWVELVRVVKDQATLLVTAASDARASSGLEGWRPMLEDLGRGDSYEWLTLSAAWASEWSTNTQWPFLNMSSALRKRYPPFAAEGEPPTPWPSADGRHAMPRLPAAETPWNPATSLVLGPGEVHTVALRLELVRSGPRGRDDALARSGAALLHATPGYVIGADMRNATLHVRPPSGAHTLEAIAEAVGVLKRGVSLEVRRLAVPPGPQADAFADAFALRGGGRGRARVRVRFSDGSEAIAHFLVVPPFAEQVSKLGTHLAHTAWLPRDYPDPFGRGASVMPWDRSTNSHVLDDARAYNVGLSDDAGAGNPLALASKVRAAPTPDEAARIDEYIQWTLYGVKPDTASPPLKSLQIRDEREGNVDAIRMTLFYYSDDLSNVSSGHFAYPYTEADKCHEPFGGPTWCMNEHMSNMTYRGFNVPHQIASYWAMYHVARHHRAIRTRMSWEWYLERAARTALTLGSAGVGFMDGTVLRELLAALQEEAAAQPDAQLEAQLEPPGTSFGSYASTLDANMRRRQQQWASKPYPYGSEFAFDTTGQEEIVVWSLWYGDGATARRTVDHILSYMRSSATWAYHGGSRSWGDVENNGKYLTSFGTGCDDRGQMHYRSGLNMIPLLEWYRAHPDDLFVLEVAMGAISGQMANIDASGAPSMMFHALPHVMDWDPHSGDYGLGFFGNALEGGAYFVTTKERGNLCYLCDIEPLTPAPQQGRVDDQNLADQNLAIVPRDAYRRQAFVEPLALLIQTDCGQIARLLYTPASRRLVVHFAAKSSCGPTMRLRLRQTSDERLGANFRVEGARLVRGAHEFSVMQDGWRTTEPVQAVVLWDHLVANATRSAA